MQQYRVLFDSLEWQNALPGARYKIYRAGGKQMRLLELDSGFVEPDWCEKGHVGLVLDGELEIDFHGSLVRYPAGAALLIPAGAASGHKARSIAPRTQLFLVEDV